MPEPVMRPKEQGMAHFVEHLIFKGTRKRKAWHILNRMENVGGDLNAYTNKEETVIYSAFLTEHFGRALELLADIVFHSTFPQNEIEKETEVIIDEIQSYEDTPSELIFDDFEDMIFRNHPLGRNILGRPDLLKKFRSEDAMAFTSRFYQPSNMVFFVLGDFNFQKIVRQVEKLLVDLPLLRLRISVRYLRFMYPSSWMFTRRPSGTCDDWAVGDIMLMMTSVLHCIC